MPSSFRAGLSWEFAARTDVGRVRRRNEDAVAFDAAQGLAFLADGIGGHQGGDVASRMAIECLQASIGRRLVDARRQEREGMLERILQACVDETNRAIFAMGKVNLRLAGMGTTLALAVFEPSRVVVGHIGDSRCYRLRGQQLERLTRDHSLVQEQIDAGELSEADAARGLQRNFLTRALGMDPRVELEMRTHDACAGDLYLLCSDGLTGMLDDSQLFDFLSPTSDLSEKADLLIGMANQRGGRDNISVVLARAGSMGGSDDCLPSKGEPTGR